MKKPKTGYDKQKKKKNKKNHYIGNLLVANPKKVSSQEKLVKFLIYIALRLVIRPRRWKDPKKNYEIIDRTYKRIMSSDFIFIPSSIAFYLIMAFMPILSLIMFLYQFESVQELLSKGHFEHWSYTLHDPSGTLKDLVRVNATYETYQADLLKHQGWAVIGLSKWGWVIENDLLSNVLGRFIPGIESFLKQIAESTQTGGKHIINAGVVTSTILSLVVSTWIAAGGFAKLVYTQSYMYEHKFVGGYWMNKIKGMFMVFIFSISLFIALTVNIITTKQIDASTTLSQTSKSAIKMTFLVLGLFSGIFIGFIVFFKLSPRYSIRLRHVIPGAMVSTIPTAGFLSLFGYITTLWSYGNYGSLGTIMYLAMSSLIVTYFIFVGLSANVAYYKTFVGNKVRNKWTLSKK